MDRTKWIVVSIITLTKHGTISRQAQTGQQTEGTPEMIEAGLVELYAFDQNNSDPRVAVEAIIRAALANRIQQHR